MIAVVANGDIHNLDWLNSRLSLAKLKIAADGGAHHIIQSGSIPDIVIGDLDSLSQNELKQLRDKEVRFETFPSEKDETDLELALTLAASQARANDWPIELYGTLGGRFDQSLANTILLSIPALEGCDVKMVEPFQSIWIIRHSTTINGKKGDIVSLIPLSGNVHVIKSVNLKWPLLQDKLIFGQARGISNELTDDNAYIELAQERDGRDSILLCIHTNQAWNR